MITFLKRLITFIIVVFVLVAASFAAVHFYVRWPVVHPEVQMTISPGTSINEIAYVLEKAGVIRCRQAFRIYIALMGYSSKIRAGDYVFESGLNEAEVVSRLLKGDFKTYRLTIPEGWTVKEIADYLKGLPIVENENFSINFLELTKNADFIRTLDIGWDVLNLEGYLYPSTYEVYRLTDPKKLITVMVDEFKKKFGSPIREKSEKLGLTPQEIVVLASIIEKETSKPGEKPIVSSVFYNRLKKGMILQSDPTVIYGLKDFNGNLTKRDLVKRHNYNTYVHPGLPPGPICNPGGEAIEAAINPAKTDYLFFVSKNNGTHEFTKSLSEHNKAVYKYQVKRGK